MGLLSWLIKSKSRSGQEFGTATADQEMLGVDAF